MRMGWRGEIFFAPTTMPLREDFVGCIRTFLSNLSKWFLSILPESLSFFADDDLEDLIKTRDGTQAAEDKQQPGG